MQASSDELCALSPVRLDSRSVLVVSCTEDKSASKMCTGVAPKLVPNAKLQFSCGNFCSFEAKTLLKFIQKIPARVYEHATGRTELEIL